MIKRVKKLNTTYIVTTTLLLLVAVRATAAEVEKEKSEAPKLIIGITVDQLRSDYLYALESQMSDGGLKMLLHKGLVYDQVVLDVNGSDATAAMAVLATGSYAFSSGVSAKEIYNAQLLRRESVFYDKDYLGNFTDRNYSPRRLNSTTLGDELKAASSGECRVYSIAPDAESAIIGAGHTANCAFWIDEKEGKWASTTYYRNFPNYIERRNKTNPLSESVSTAVWEPLHEGEKLVIMPYHYETDRFSHNFMQYGQPNYQWYKTSPLVNDAIVELSKVLLKTGSLGQHETTDMLQLTFYCGPWMNERPERYALELQDAYLRLDRSIEELLKAVQQSVGLHNTLVYLVGTGETGAKVTEVDGTKQGVFTARRCTSLLNSYLVSVYGQAQYVIDYADGQIYLDHRVIEQKGLRVADVQQTAAEFVMMFSGVEDVTTQYRILHQDVSQSIGRMRRAYNRTYGGDLILSLLPGWTSRYDDDSDETPQTRYDVAPGPAILMAPHITPERISVPVDAAVIAPTIAACIKIRAPSGSRAAPLRTTR